MQTDQKENCVILAAGRTPTLLLSPVPLQASCFLTCSLQGLAFTGNEPWSASGEAIPAERQGRAEQKSPYSPLSLFDAMLISCPLVVALCPYTSPAEDVPCSSLSI